LVSFVVEQEKRSRSLLTEKESEFDQLDLLHKSIIEHVNAGIVTIDLKGKIKSFNRAAEEISGARFSEVEGSEIDYVFPGFSKMLDTIKSEKSGEGKTVDGEIVVSNRQNRDIVLGFSVSSLMDSTDNRIGDILIVQDFTATKEMEKEVEKSKNLALIGKMAAGLAHEIRNPLTALSGSIQLLKRNLDLDETDTRLMQIVLRGRDQLENLISNFLLLARPNPADREEIDMNIILDDVLDSLRCSPDWNENIVVKKELSDRTRIYGNRTELKQMLWNLVLNAVQAMPDGGLLKISTTVTASDSGEQFLDMYISDTGCGIEPDQESKVLTPFYTTKEKGTGLGLPIASRILESHGGEINIKSEVGKGTMCEVLLPLNMSSERNNMEYIQN
jgi:two-component system sensor histidine kinase PilS (NtrC family)